MKKVQFSIFFIVFTIFTNSLYADAFSDNAKIFINTISRENSNFLQRLTFDQLYEPSSLGRVAGTYRWCKNTSQFILDNRNLSTTDRNYWNREVIEYERLFQTSQNALNTEIERILIIQGGNAALSYQQLFFSYVEETMESLSDRFSETFNLSNQSNRSNNNPRITIINKTGYTIYYLYISPTTSDSWGNDKLRSDQVIENGQSVNITLDYSLNNINRYDIRITDLDGDSYTKWNVLITNNLSIIFYIQDID